MTADRDLARLVRSWLREDENDSADAIVDVVLDRLDTTPQHRSWWPVRRSLMPTYAKLVAAAAALVVVAVVGYNLLPAQNGFGGPPTPSPVASPTPAATPVPIFGGVGNNFGPNTYSLGDPTFGQALEFTFADTWTLERLTRGEASFRVPGDARTFIGFFLVSRVYREPCHPETGADNMPPTGGAGQLEAALTTLPGFTATSVADRTIAGLPARGFAIVNSIDAAGCSDPPWLSLWDPVGGEVARATGNAVGESTEPMWIVNLGNDRRPLLIVTEPGQDVAAGQALLDAILASLKIE
jgi:hypothetical protein